MIEPRSAEEIKTRAREATELVENRAFLESVAELRKQWFGELMNPNLVETARIVALVERLRGLEAIPQKLASTMRDVEFTPRGSNARRT
jgi:hypothetical protein